jgi:hypothetical protein
MKKIAFIVLLLIFITICYLGYQWGIKNNQKVIIPFWLLFFAGIGIEYYMKKKVISK